ncbi:hypothetical protein C0993_006262 [Termitomyces sp. T159_Od127]|nr:hypothetical protein C0993_006262 [Termitomyces sp. T159_Od127]
MHLSAVFSALVLSVLVICSPPTNAIQSSNETQSYIVTFKSADTRPSFATANSTNVLYDYDIINGIAGNFTTEQIQELRADPNVEDIYEDNMMELDAIQTNATWGLARLSSKEKLRYQNATATNFTFYYNQDAGRNVDIYIVGMLLSLLHKGKFAFKYLSRFGLTSVDVRGGELHLADILMRIILVMEPTAPASNTYGVAKQADIIAVKVMDKGDVRISNLISGLQYVYNSVKRSGRRSVVSVSISGPATPVVDDAVVKCSAGNKGREASRYSPARVPSAITVTSSDIADQQVKTSNFGLAVDIVAPGRNIISTGIGGRHATAIKSGTSMATAYVTGLVATFLTFGKYTPAEMQVFLANHAQKGALSHMCK